MGNSLWLTFLSSRGRVAQHVSHGVPPTRMSRDLAARRKHRSSSRRPAAAATASWEADKKNHPSTDVFDILGIDRRSSTEQIKQAYRRKARELHPDVNASENATAEFLELRRAYNVSPCRRRTLTSVRPAAPPTCIKPSLTYQYFNFITLIGKSLLLHRLLRPFMHVYMHMIQHAQGLVHRVHVLAA